VQGLFTTFIETFTVVIIIIIIIIIIIVIITITITITTGNTLFSMALAKHIECEGGRAISRILFSEYDLRKSLTKPCTIQNLAKRTESFLSTGEVNLCGLIAVIIKNLNERELCFYGYIKTKCRKTYHGI
jgi:hypothetical protein